MTEKLYVLYGSQMGNSEAAAKDFCTKAKSKLDGVETICTQLDDFLDVHHAEFTKCIVIFVSSYGVGQAPLGCHKFRTFTETLIEKNDNNLLDGLRYAICGLGDTQYTTFLKNPKTINQGLTVAGAKRIGELGTADASQIGDKAQDKTIARWMDDIWDPLGKELASTSAASAEQLQEMQSKTIPILQEIDPDYEPPKELLAAKSGGASTTKSSMGGIALSCLIGAILAATAAFGFAASKSAATEEADS
mmetsp:Transcript_55299/g.134314  ORF Transcript_55299/g.134314 Transcript_55299/m.134314 type:complete len:248 (-) Transcript_55299:309-1052(-)